MLFNYQFNRNLVNRRLYREALVIPIDGVQRALFDRCSAPQRQRVPEAGLRRGREQPAFDLRPQGRGRGGFGELHVEAGEPLAPEAEVRLQGAICPQPRAV